MNVPRIACAAGFALTLGACAPLQQAPLVYSSKIAFGADVSATTTEAPGVSVVLGYKQVDAAYVPVAIAKECDEPTEASTRCQNGGYNIMKLTSTNATASEGGNSAYAAAQDFLDSYKKLMAQLGEQQTTVTLLTAQEAAKASAINTLTATYTQLAAVTPRSAEQDAALAEATKKKEASENDLKQIRASLKTANDSKSALETQLKNFKPEALANANKLVKEQVSREDAYSVFGSFEGKARGGGGDSKAEAALIVGKVFSTGMAAQNLTSGLGQYYNTLALERAASMTHNCIQMVLKDEKLKTDADAKKIALEACRGISQGPAAVVSGK